MAVRTQTAQEISRTRAGARSRRLRDNVALPPLQDGRLVLAMEGDARCAASWPVLVEPATHPGDGPRTPHPV